MAAKLAHRFPGCHVPESDGVRIIGGGEQTSIGAESDVADDARRHAHASPEDGAGFQIEDNHQSVGVGIIGAGLATFRAGIDLTRGGQHSSVRAEGGTLEPACLLIVAEAGPVRADCPGLDPAALGCRGDKLALGD